MLSTLEKAIPSPEIQRLFNDYINDQKELFSLDEEKNKLESDLLAKEKELRSTAKQEQLSNKVINMRKDIDKMRRELSNVDTQSEDIKSKLSSLKDELHCVEIHEKRRNDVIFDTERTLLELREENDILKREVGYLTNTKNDMERAYRAIGEEKKLVDREIMTLRSQMGSVNSSVYTNKHQNMTSTMNPGDYTKQRFFPQDHSSYAHNQNEGSFASGINTSYQNPYHPSKYDRK